MEKLKKRILKERVDYLALLTKRDYVVGYWNGLVHVYIRSKGTMLITGTLRECKDAVDMVILGYELAINDSIRYEDKNHDKV